MPKRHQPKFFIESLTDSEEAGLARSFGVQDPIRDMDEATRDYLGFTSHYPDVSEDLESESGHLGSMFDPPVIGISRNTRDLDPYYQEKLTRGLIEKPTVE